MSPARPDVITVGESMITLRAAGQIRLAPQFASSVAGAESNVAIGLARLGHAVTWAGVLGDDEPAALITRTLRGEGVNIRPRVNANRPTGLILVERVLATRARVAYYRSQSAGASLEPADVSELFDPAPRILHVTGITPALSESAAAAISSAMKLAKDAGATVCFDVNFRSRLWSADAARNTLATLAEAADIVVASEDELPLIARESEGEVPHETAGILSSASESLVVGRLLDGVASAVIIKRGAAGASGYFGSSKDLQRVDVPAREVAVVDTIGAGDAFCSGVLSARLDGLDWHGALLRGTATAAFVVATVGDWEGAPTRAELELLDVPSGETVR